MFNELGASNGLMSRGEVRSIPSTDRGMANAKDISIMPRKGSIIYYLSTRMRGVRDIRAIGVSSFHGREKFLQLSRTLHGAAGFPH